jgi:putative transposase
LHAHIANQRRDFHHKTAHRLVSDYGLIVIEDLNVCGLAAGPLAKHVHDAAWGQFIRILVDKASSAGRQVIAVNPVGTTQNCSRCGTCVSKGLGDRWHKCHQCGLSLGRDENAARNVLQRALIETARMGPSGVNGGGLPVPWPEKPRASANGLITFSFPPSLGRCKGVVDSSRE